MSGFSREQIEQADSLDLAGYLESRGYRLVPKGSQYRLAEHDSLYIKGNQWYWFSQKKGGKTISFLTQYEGRTFEEAMNELLGPGRTLTRTVPAVPKPEPQKKLLLPVEFQKELQKQHSFRTLQVPRYLPYPNEAIEPADSQYFRQAAGLLPLCRHVPLSDE